MKIGLSIMPMWAPSVPPLGLTYIYEVLKKNGHEVSIRDYNVILHKEYLKIKKPDEQDIWGGGFAFDWEMPTLYTQKMASFINPYLDRAISEIEKWAADEKLEAIGLSVFGTNQHSTRYVCSRLKERLPDLKIFVGGAQTFTQPWKKEVLVGMIDACVSGEGEASTVELIDKWSKADTDSIIPGVYRKKAEGELLPFTPRPLIELEALPMVSFKDINFSLYDWDQIPIQMSRGCVAICTFCDEVKFWERFRYRQPEAIFEEMKTNSQRVGLKNFLVMDSLLNGHHRNFVKLADLIKLHKLDITYGGNVRVDKRLTKDIIQTLKESGCAHLTFGLESGSQPILDSMKKGIRLEWAIQNFKDCTQSGILVNINIIVGFPGETEDDFQLTMNFLEEHRDSYYSVSVGLGMGLGPNTDVWDNAAKYGIRVDENGHPWYGPNGWETTDGKNTQAIRDERLTRLRRMLKSHQKNYAPQID